MSQHYTAAYIVPLGIEVLPIGAGTTAIRYEMAGQLADFSLMPHAKNTSGDGSCAPPRIRPNVSEDLVAKPFESTNDPLELGVHLRWTLPEEYRRARVTDLPGHDAERARPEPKLREVPNRWLVERRAFRPGTDEEAKWAGEPILPMRWVVEADALSEKKERGSSAIPFEAAADTGYPAHRYLGRVHTYAEWLDPERERGEYLDKLTAFGYGEPLFSAYYPESRNVFGFHDDLTFSLDGEDRARSFTDAVSGVTFEFRYVVCGWYENARRDPLTAASFRIWTNPAGRPDLDPDLEPDYPAGVAGATAAGEERPFGLLPYLDRGVGEPVEDFFWLVAPGSVKDLGAILIDNPIIIGGEQVVDRAALLDNTNILRELLTRSQADLNEARKLRDNAHASAKRSQLLWEENRASHAEVVLHIKQFKLLEARTDQLEKDMLRQSEQLRSLHPSNLQWDNFFITHATTNPADREGPVPPALLRTDRAMDARIRGRSVPTGRVRNVNWPPTDAAGAVKQDMNKVRVVLGNSPGQALAALLAAAPGQQAGTEQVLDAIQLGLFGEEDRQDFPGRLEAGLHEGGFISVAGETRWTVRELPKTGVTAPPPSGSETVAAAVGVIVDLPDEWSLLLQKLNTLQDKVDRNSFKLDDRRRQFYADWYKYQLAAYDFSLDEITAEAHVNEIREFLAELVYRFYEDLGKQQKSLDRIKATVAELRSKIDDWNGEEANHDHLFTLQTLPGTRYWEAREPVLLIQGDDAVPEQRVPRTERTYVQLFPDLFDPATAVAETLKDFVAAHKLHTAGVQTPLPFQDGGTAPWHPLLLDWEVELFPFTKPGDKDFHQQDWPTNAIVANYDLPERGVDLQMQADALPGGELYQQWIEDHPDIQSQGGKRLQSIQGRSLLTPDAHRPLVENLQRLLEQAEGQRGEAMDHATKKNFKQLIDRLNGLPLLSQNLTGFNDALLMRKQILQLQVKDPLARTDILHQFTEELRAAIGDGNDVAPLPSHLFLPLREGAFRIRRLRLIDGWGRTRELKEAQLDQRVVVADPLKPTAEELPAANRRAGMGYLPPRIAQPARLNFRWTSAERAEAEAGSFVADSPICGYVVPNFLDQSLHVHDAAGAGLGVLARSGQRLTWNPTPGREAVRDTYNRHLQKFVESTRRNGLDFLTDLLKTARNSLSSTQPENYAQFDGTALLMGRPLALVRAELSLSLRGIAAVNNSWEAREAAYMHRQPNTSPAMGFDRLRFPVRIGDEFKAGDGCLAYYIEKPDQDISELFSYYTDRESLKTEEFWGRFDIQKKWLAVYRERREGRLNDQAALTVEISGISNVATTDGGEEMAALLAQKLANQRHLTKEIEQLDGEIRKRVNAITMLWREHGYQGRLPPIEGLSEEELAIMQPGIYRPHSDLLTLSLEEEPLRVGLLMDPRAAVHLTTGILPVKRIDIPTEQFAVALNNIQVAFLTAPVLSHAPGRYGPEESAALSPQEQHNLRKFQLVFPMQRGFNWAWLQPTDRDAWDTYEPNEVEQPPVGFTEEFGPQAIWEGWMRAIVNE